MQLKRHSQTVQVKVGKERVFQPAATHALQVHALQVHVWGGILKVGATNIGIFDQTMDAPLYVTILEDVLLPFLAKAFQGQKYRFMQDNNPKHTSSVVRKYRHGLFHPSLTKGEGTPHCSPSQTGGFLSAATALPLITGAELETGPKGLLTATT